MFIKAIKSLFSIRQIIVLFFILTISFVFKNLIVNCLHLDLSVYVEFLLAMVPTCFVAKGAKILADFYLGQFETIGGNKLSKLSSPLNLYADNAGEGSSKQGQNIGRDLEAAKNKYELDEARKNQSKLSGDAKAKDHFSNYNYKVQQAQVGEKIDEINRKQALQEQARAEERRNTLLANAPYINETLNRFLNSNPINLVTIEDPNGVGARGYQPGGLNQPFAKNLANSQEVLRTSGKTISPINLDNNAKRFLVDFLRDQRSEVYGPNPTKGGTMINKDVINKLKKA